SLSSIPACRSWSFLGRSSSWNGPRKTPGGSPVNRGPWWQPRLDGASYCPSSAGTSFAPNRDRSYPVWTSGFASFGPTFPSAPPLGVAQPLGRASTWRGGTHEQGARLDRGRPSDSGRGTPGHSGTGVRGGGRGGGWPGTGSRRPETPARRDRRG